MGFLDSKWFFVVAIPLWIFTICGIFYMVWNPFASGQTAQELCERANGTYSNVTGSCFNPDTSVYTGTLEQEVEQLANECIVEQFPNLIVIAIDCISYATAIDKMQSEGFEIKGVGNGAVFMERIK